MKHLQIAAVDLGSNSFRLMIGRIEGDQIFAQDNLKEPVRLAAGLSSDRMLDASAQARGLEALRKFGERLRGFRPSEVRAVGTNSLRVAKNSAAFLELASQALGFPIEVISGREEARLIYLGVAHTLPDPGHRQLVFDIGGGSTEFIIGSGYEPIVLESLYMGCVSYSLRYFPGGIVDKQRMREAEVAALKELETIERNFRKVGWEFSVASSGSAKAIAELLELNGYSESGITREGLQRLRTELIRAGDVQKLAIQGVRPDRVPVLAGGFAIMNAVAEVFNLEHVAFSDGALRQGVLFDLVGRYDHADQRDNTVEAFARRHQVDAAQAERVAQTADMLYAMSVPPPDEDEDIDRRFLGWAARLHEVGHSIAHASYHKHSAYILGNADMPGFSRMDQARLALLALAHRGKLDRIRAMQTNERDWLLILCLRLAVILHRARDGGAVPQIELQHNRKGTQVIVGSDCLRERPLTSALLEDEERQWQQAGLSVRLKVERLSAGMGRK
ncbi:exopolyphosphatase [Niveibacterium sp. SC-1]|uniref:exopolyphosphatase n=1 Tax=Niveibacterium sp. SC-1 TaxID=3135646 RepID=UPI00311E691F